MVKWLIEQTFHLRSHGVRKGEEWIEMMEMVNYEGFDRCAQND